MRKSWFLVIGLALVLTTVFLSGCTTTPNSVPGRDILDPAERDLGHRHRKGDRCS